MGACRGKEKWADTCLGKSSTPTDGIVRSLDAMPPAVPR